MHSMDLRKDSSQPFGYYTPKIAMCIQLLVKVGLGRGKLKKLFSRLLIMANKDKPIDFSYHQMKFRLHVKNNTIENKILTSSKLREATELKFMAEFLKNGGTFVDIGANIGYYSLWAVKLGASKVLSVEPNPLVMCRLKENIKFNRYGNIIKPLQVGVGEKKELLMLNISATDLGSSSLLHLESTKNRVDINISPLRDILIQEDIKKVDVLKIDIEGYEDRALLPFFNSINPSLHPRLIIIEYSSQQDWNNNILACLYDSSYRVITKTRGNMLLAKCR